MPVRERPIRVAVVGANAAYGWGGTAHLHALNSLAGFEVAAILNSTEASARANAAHYGVEKAYWSVEDLASDDAIDLVSVCVRVDQHHSIVSSLLDSGKSVLCEWPLGSSLAEAEDLASRAASRGTLGVIGLQARQSPAVILAREMIRAERIGPLQFVRIDQSLPFQPNPSMRTAYLQSASSGADFLSVPVAHALDVLSFCIGPFMLDGALTATHVPTVKITETGNQVTRSSPDQLVLSGATATGALVSGSFRGGLAAAGGFTMEITGRHGEIVIQGGDGERVQMAHLKLYLRERDGRSVQVEQDFAETELDRTFGIAANTVRLYKNIRTAIIEKGERPASFSDAVSLHKLIDRVRDLGNIGLKTVRSK